MDAPVDLSASLAAGVGGRRPTPVGLPVQGNYAARLTRAQKLELYRWMRLTRSLEERLVALYRQTKVVGGLFRSLGQEADACGSAYALERRDIMSPLIRNLGSMLVKGATPTEILKQYMAKGDSPTRGRELNIHFGDLDRGFVGQISHLGDMVPVMAGVALSFKLRGEDRVVLVYVGDGATSTGAFHEGINFAAVQKVPLVCIVENNGYAYSTPTEKQTAARAYVDKAPGYGIPGVVADGNDVLATYEVTRAAVDRARAGGGPTLIELVTYRRKGHAEHDPIDRYIRWLGQHEHVTADEFAALDADVLAQIDRATDEAEASGFPEPVDCLDGIYADPPALAPHWYRDGVRSAVERNERPASWGTHDG